MEHHKQDTIDHGLIARVRSVFALSFYDTWERARLLFPQEVGSFRMATLDLVSDYPNLLDLV